MGVSDGVDHSVADGVALVRIVRPEVRNAIDAGCREALIEALALDAADDSVRALVLTGTEDAFCSGADLRAAGSSSGGPDPRRTEEALRQGAQRLFRALWDFDKPTVAAVNGVAAGLGCQLALACDFVVAASDARFIEPYTRRGLVLDAGGAWLLPRLVGLARARRMAILGEELGASDALQLGVVLSLAAPGLALEPALEVARRLASGPTRALGLTKRLLNRSFESTLDASLDEEAVAQGVAAATEDLREGIAAFREKREPKFGGR